MNTGLWTARPRTLVALLKMVVISILAAAVLSRIVAAQASQNPTSKGPGNATKPSDDKPSLTEAQIAVALSAAPGSVAEGAAAGMFDVHGHFKPARPGTNSWTCLGVDEAASDKDAIEHHPACYDKYGLEWIRAFNAGRVPNPKHVGYAYMLQGGSSWSNTDPKAIKLAEGQKDYIRLPPHVMILGAEAARSSGLPSGEANPQTSQPFVMFGGTPYAIVIVPVK